MQTFLTSSDADPQAAIVATFDMLDQARLGKQRVEAYQILLAHEATSRTCRYTAWTVFESPTHLPRERSECCRVAVRRRYPNRGAPMKRFVDMVAVTFLLLIVWLLFSAIVHRLVELIQP